MLKSFIASAAALSLWAGLAPAADAKVNFELYLGVPYYNERIGPDYRYYDGRGWYRERDRGRVSRDRLSCREARRLVRDNGYRNVSARDCSGRTYTFRATRSGRNVVVYVNARTGSVRRG